MAEGGGGLGTPMALWHRHAPEPPMTAETMAPHVRTGRSGTALRCGILGGGGGQGPQKPRGRPERPWGHGQGRPKGHAAGPSCTAFGRRGLASAPPPPPPSHTPGAQGFALALLRRTGAGGAEGMLAPPLTPSLRVGLAYPSWTPSPPPKALRCAVEGQHNVHSAPGGRR